MTEKRKFEKNPGEWWQKDRFPVRFYREKGAE